MTERFDAIVIGGGSGGVAFARTAGGLGASVCLIEQNRIGGTCVNRGCVPKKLMWQAIWTQERARAACIQGLAPSPPRLDFPTLQRQIGAKLATIRDSYTSNLVSSGVTCHRGTAALTGPGRVQLGDTTLEAEAIVLATGATPQVPELDGSAAVETSDDVFGWSTLPESIALLGAGYVGCEFASIFAGLGVEVHLIDPGDRLLSGFDADMAALTCQVLTDRGVQIHFGAKPKAVHNRDDGKTVTLNTGESFGVARVVAATGRAPRTRLPGGVTDGLEIADTGAFAVDEGLQTSKRGVYAVGDCADRLPLTPVATRDGEILARQLYGEGTSKLVDLSQVARACFTMPPIAQIGDPSAATCTTGVELGDGALAPKGHWTSRCARKIDGGAHGLAGIAAMGYGAPDIVTALGASLVGADPKSVTGIHPTDAEEYIGRE